MSCVNEIQYIMVKHISFIYKKTIMILVVIIGTEREIIRMYIHVHMSLISMTNKSVMTFLYVNKICVCLSVWFNFVCFPEALPVG